jgi:signal transduction histidine kinase
MDRSARRTIWLFSGLVVYIVAQFAWWAVLLLRRGEEVDHLQAELAALGGRPGWQDESGRRAWMILGEGGVFLLLLLVVVFLTYRAVLKDLRLASAQRNFLLAVTHELRTPIAAIKLQLQTMARTGLAPEQREGLQRTAEEEADRLAILTDKVLLAATGDTAMPLERVEVDVMEIVLSAVDRARAQAASGHELVLDAPPSMRTRTDPHAVRSILDNLVENATKYAPLGTRITVMVKPGSHGWRLMVNDEGPGIPAEERERIFERFYRMGNEETRHARGTGLGLYIVKRLVQRLGGTIEVRAKRPHGTIFAASFPHE